MRTYKYKEQAKVQVIYKLLDFLRKFWDHITFDVEIQYSLQKGYIKITANRNEPR